MQMIGVSLSSLLKPQLLSGAVLVLAAFAISLFFEGHQDIHYAPAILCLLVLSCVAVLPSIWRGLEIPRAPAALLLFAFWLYVTLSLSWSSVPYASLVTYLVFVACPLVFFAPLLSSSREEWARAMAIALFAAILAAAAWAVIQFLFLQDIYGTRAHHPLPSPNNLAALINLGLLPAIALFMVVQKRRFPFYASLLFVLILFAAVVATESRGGLLSALIATAVLLFTLRRHPPVLSQRLLVLLASGIALFFALGSLSGLQFGSRLMDLAAIGSDSTALARLAIWKNAWQMVLDHFWLGTGFGTFYLYYPGYRLPGTDNSTGHWAHMDPLQYWAELGVAAPLLFYALGTAIAIRTVKALRALPPDAAGERAAITGLFCGLLAMVLHTHVDFNLYVMPILIVAGAWLALWYVLTAMALGDRAWLPVPLPGWQKGFMAGVTIAIAGLMGIMAASSAAGQYHLVRAQELIRQGMVSQFTTAIEESEKWAPRSFVDLEVQLAAFYIDLLGINAAALFSPEEQKQLYDQTQELLAIAESQNPPWAEVDYKRGLLYKSVGETFEPEAPAKALEAFEQAVAKNPAHFLAREELARIYIRRGHVEEAWELLETGLKYPHGPSVEETYLPLMDGIAGLVELKRAYDKAQDL